MDEISGRNFKLWRLAAQDFSSDCLTSGARACSVPGMKIDITPPVVVPAATLHLSNKELIVLTAALGVVQFGPVSDRLRNGTTLGKMAEAARLDTSTSSVNRVISDMYGPLMAKLTEIAKDASI